MALRDEIKKQALLELEIESEKRQRERGAGVSIETLRKRDGTIVGHRVTTQTDKGFRKTFAIIETTEELTAEKADALVADYGTSLIDELRQARKQTTEPTREAEPTKVTR